MMKIKNLPLIIIFLAATSSQLKAQTTIKYTNFKILEKQNKVAIDWTTDGSVITNYFEIQKSTDGVNFKTIALVMGPDPSLKTCDCYGCFDKISKKAFYRLVHVSNSGIEQTSETKLLAKN